MSNSFARPWNTRRANPLGCFVPEVAEVQQQHRQPRCLPFAPAVSASRRVIKKADRPELEEVHYAPVHVSAVLEAVQVE